MSILNLAEMLDMSVEILKKYIKTISLFALGYGIITGIISFIAFLFGGIFIGISAFSGPVLPIIGGVVLGVIIMSLYLSMRVGVIKISSQDFFNEKVYTHNAVKASFKKLPQVIGSTILSFILFLPVGGVMFVITYSVFKLLENYITYSEPTPLSVIGFFILVVILIILMFFILTAFSALVAFSVHSITIEDMGPVASIKRSFQLVKGNFWNIFWSIFFISIAIYVIRASFQGFISLIVGILYLTAKLVNLNTDFFTFFTMANAITAWPLSLLFWVIISPLSSIMTTQLYFNQRFKKEGYDMILRLRKIEKNNERKAIEDVLDNSNSI